MPPRLAGIFGPDMVLQRDKPVPIWGWAEPGQSVELSFAGQTRSATADAAGRWQVVLNPMPAGGPYDLKLTGADPCPNVMVGDVWVLSGQSNMQFGLNYSNGLDAKAPEVLAEADHPQIRLWTVPQLNQPLAREPRPDYERLNPKTTWEGRWLVCTPENVAKGHWGGFSAIGYHFGQAIHKEFDVPVGLVMIARGGTAVEAWMSSDALNTLPNARFACPAIEALLAIRPEAAGEPGKQDFNSTRACYNTFLAPLFPMAVKGILWNQGESNSRVDVEHYEDKLSALIVDWRRRLGQGDVPFLIVQLFNWRSMSPLASEVQNWATIREAQWNVAQSLPACGIVVSMDLAETDTRQSETQIHPRHKKPVADRLALVARAVAYGQPVEYCGPVYQQMRLEGTAIRVTFTHLGGGLVVRGEALHGFQIAGEDRRFVDAEARLDGDSVIVSSAQTPKPVAVRYNWGQFIKPLGNLYNRAGLPAPPFRSDTWQQPRLRAVEFEGKQVTVVFDQLVGGLKTFDGGKAVNVQLAGADRQFVDAEARVEGERLVSYSPQVPQPMAIRYNVNWKRAGLGMGNLCDGLGQKVLPFKTDDWPE